MKLVSESVAGNLHEATAYCNAAGIHDIVAMDSSGRYTVIVYRLTDEEYEERRKKIEVQRLKVGKFSL